MSRSRNEKKDDNNSSGISSYAKWLGLGLVGGGIVHIVEAYTSRTEQSSQDNLPSANKPKK